jgi:ABC-type transport system substrate-binding protein/ABC-type dipeptide/oligopeptide/nickel transport system permease component
MLVLLLAVAPGGAVGHGSLTLGTQLEPPGLDPTASAAAAIGELTVPTVYEGLVHLGPDSAIEPALATAWEVSPDGLTYLFHLRPGVRFHDGATFDADAVRFSLTRAIDPHSLNPQKALLQCIGSVEVVDQLTVSLHLVRRCSGLLEVLGWGAAVIVSPDSAATNATHPVGTGPFRFAEWQRGVSVSLARNDQYWGGAPALDGVTYRFLGDPSAALDALIAGDVDGFAAFPTPESVARLQHDRRFRVVVAPSEGKTIMAINNRQKPFDDVRVRQALAYAIDRRAIIDAAMFGYGQVIGSHYTPQDPGYVDLTHTYEYDPARARALLAEAGYPNGFEATLKLPPLSYARRSGEIIAAELAAVGVRVKILPMEWASWLDQVFGRHDFDLTIVAHVEPMDFDIYGRDEYYFGYAAPAFKALLRQVDEAPDEDRRLVLLGDVQRMITRDAVNAFLFDFPGFSVWDARIQDIWYRTPVQTFDLAHARFEEGGGGAVDQSAASRMPLFLVAGAAGIGLFALLYAAGPVTALRQALSLGVTLLGASVVVFAIVQLAPGDPARFMLGMNADPAALAALHQQLGLDQPFAPRYLAWLAGLVTGDFGTSWTYRVPVASLIMERLQVSLPLTILALLLSTVLALTLAIVSVLWRGNPVGRAVAMLLRIGIAVPNFWLGIMLVAVFSVGLRWFSAGGFAGWEAGPWAALRSLAMPAVALALPQAAILGRVLRGELLETLSQDFMRTARAKGLGETTALLRHALPNCLAPVLTILGMQFSFLLAGGVLIENVFFLPGIGRLVFEAIIQRDLVVVESVAIVLVFQVIVVSLIADLACAAADPRRRVSAR